MQNCVLGCGGSAKGERFFSGASIGEYTVVASAKRGVRGGLMDESDELDDVRSLVVIRGAGRFFSCAAFGDILMVTKLKNKRKDIIELRNCYRKSTREGQD